MYKLMFCTFISYYPSCSTTCYR